MYYGFISVPALPFGLIFGTFPGDHLHEGLIFRSMFLVLPFLSGYGAIGVIKGIRAWYFLPAIDMIGICLHDIVYNGNGRAIEVIEDIHMYSLFLPIGLFGLITDY